MPYIISVLACAVSQKHKLIFLHPGTRDRHGSEREKGWVTVTKPGQGVDMRTQLRTKPGSM